MELVFAWLGLAAFVLIALSTVAISRLRVRRLNPPGLRSRTERLIGTQGHVTVAIDVHGGRVLVGGEDWAAKAQDPLPEGTPVLVEGADGIALIVVRAPDEA